jgi:hypothetical protein
MLFVFVCYSDVQHMWCCVFVLCFFILCTLWWQFLWIVHLWLPFGWKLKHTARSSMYSGFCRLCDKLHQPFNAQVYRDLENLMSNTCGVVFLFCVSSSCVPYDDSFSGLSICDCLSVFSDVYFRSMCYDIKFTKH